MTHPTTQESHEKIIEEITACLAQLNDLAMDEITPTNFGFAKIAPKMICKVEVLFQAIIHRMIELTNSILSEFSAGRNITCANLSRAIIETYGIYYYAKMLLSDFQAGSIDICTFDEKILALMFGSRVKDCAPMPNAINIITILEKASKDDPVIMKRYNELCEFTHPNYLGLLGAYSDFKPPMNFSFKETLKTNDEISKFLIGHVPYLLIVIIYGIDSAQKEYSQIAKKLSDFSE